MKYYRSEFSRFRYFTPEWPAPLNLDLASLSGGGCAPSQFEGETHDKREVYCRYRDGRLSITVANSAGDDPLKNGTTVLAAEVGPPLAGALALGQLCRYAGITINGTTPPLPSIEEWEEEGYEDLSGNVTFYDVGLQSTFRTQQLFLEAALERLPDAVLIQPRASSSSSGPRTGYEGYEICEEITELVSDSSYVFLGKTPSTSLLKTINSPRALTDALESGSIFSLGTRGFEYPIQKYSNNVSSAVKTAIGKDILVSGQCEDCLYNSISIRAEFNIDDSGYKKNVEKIDKIIDEFFPKYHLAYFDLLSGERVSDREHYKHVDSEVTRWINDNDDCWYSVSNFGDRDNPRYVGTRPMIVSAN